MDTKFWHQRWQANSIDFHKSEANPLLVNYFKQLSLVQDSRVFVPLCGKTLDIGWLLANGYRVAGVELSELAIEQLFTELETEPAITVMGELKCFSAQNIDIFVGDIFALTSTMLGPINAVFDRAALVALPEKMRTRYSEHLTDITHSAPQLLITYEYDQNQMQGPPFSIHNQEICRLYQDDYQVSPVISVDVVGGLKGKCEAKENLWLLK